VQALVNKHTIYSLSFAELGAKLWCGGGCAFYVPCAQTAMIIIIIKVSIWKPTSVNGSNSHILRDNLTTADLLNNLVKSPQMQKTNANL